MDELDKKIYGEIQGRKESKELYENLFNKLFQIELSNCEARKELRGIENYLDFKRENDIQVQNNEDMPRYNETVELMQDGTYKSDKLLSMNSEQSKDPSYLLQAHGFDEKYWHILSAKNNIWNSYSKQDGIMTLYSSKISVKPVIQEFDIEWVKEVFKELKPLPPIKAYENNKGKKVVELQYADIHIGLRGCDYEDELNTMTDKIIDKFKDADIFVLPIGQDLFNVNHVSGAIASTTKGTPIEQSLSYKDMFKSGLRVVCRIIDNIIRNTDSTIECIFVKGNHDEQSCFGLFQSIMQRYRNNENITFDDGMEERKYRRYGVNGIGFGHGATEGKRIFGLFPVEAPEIFANSKYREFHLSHLHNENVISQNGITFRRMPTVNENDNWHNSKGYVGATKRIQAFVYNTEIGLEEIKYFYL